MVMMGRTAEALFWIGRYTERVENHARLIDVYYHIREDKDTDEQQTWSRLINTIGNRPQFVDRYGKFTEHNTLQYITLDQQNTNSLLACTNHARANLRTIRERMPSEMWDILNSMYVWLKDKQTSDITSDSPHQFYRHIRDSLSMFQGASLSVMPRENEWYFVEAGRYLERAENLLRLLQSLSMIYDKEETSSYPFMLSVLRSVSGYEVFRKHYADTVSLVNITEFLLLDSSFPRSVSFCFSQLEKTLRSIEDDESDLSAALKKLARQVSKIKANLACMDREDIHSGKLDLTPTALLETCYQLGNQMSHIFFPNRQGVTA
ncbi:hypothetical protein D3C73_657000 [compost metagenome]